MDITKAKKQRITKLYAIPILFLVIGIMSFIVYSTKMSTGVPMDVYIIGGETGNLEIKKSGEYSLYLANGTYYKDDERPALHELRMQITKEGGDRVDISVHADEYDHFYGDHLFVTTVYLEEGTYRIRLIQSEHSLLLTSFNFFDYYRSIIIAAIVAIFFLQMIFGSFVFVLTKHMDLSVAWKKAQRLEKEKTQQSLKGEDPIEEEPQHKRVDF